MHKVAGHKINTIQKSIVFLVMNNSKVKIKRTVPFTIASKWLKYLEINLTRSVKHSENYKTLLKEVKDDLSK